MDPFGMYFWNKLAGGAATRSKRAKSSLRRFVPCLETMEERCVPAVNASVAGGVLTITDATITNPNHNSDLVIIYDNGQSTAGNLRVYDYDAATGVAKFLDQTTANQDIWKVNFNTYTPTGYNSEVIYDLQQPLGAGLSRVINGSMHGISPDKTGMDSFYADVDGLGQHAGLSINVSGDAYNNRPDYFRAT